MTRNVLLTCAALLLAPLAALRAAGLDLCKPIRIETGYLEGVSNPENDVVVFKGIPYAAPPVGNLRWREPLPAVKWDGVRKADKFGASCPQPPSPSGKQPAEMSEDCLFINVWTPAKPAEDKLAVLFFIHGGMGVFGSGNLDGTELARKGIIVVSVNYRLGLFAGMGHPELTAESPHHTCGTYGMLDLIAALRWVQTNIAAFGGDAAKVTIAGHSSGASAMHYLVSSPEAKGLFRGAIGVSFGYDYLMKPQTIPFIRQKEENGLAFAKLKNCSSLEELRKIPAMDLVASGAEAAKAKLYHLGSGAARDGWAFPVTYGEALDTGLASDVPTLTGFTADDFGPPAQQLKTTVATFATSLPGQFGENREAFKSRADTFLPLCPVTTDQEAREMLKRVQIEYRMATVSSWAKRRAMTGKSPVFVYLFDQSVASERGAYHGSDLAYWFYDLKAGDRAWTDGDRRVADQVSSYWANFVKTGDPNGGSLPAWAVFDANRPVAMHLGANSGPQAIAGGERLNFYRALLEK